MTFAGFPATIVFGVWGLFVGELSPYILMLFSISIGLVVDDSVHVLSKYISARRSGQTPEASVLISRVEAAQLRWFRTLRDRNVRDARKALEGNDAPLALAFSERALRYAPEDREASRLFREAETPRSKPRLNRTDASASSAFNPIALRTCEGSGIPDVQADPVEAASLGWSAPRMSCAEKP